MQYQFAHAPRPRWLGRAAPPSALREVPRPWGFAAGQRGQSIVEFAVLLPVLVLVGMVALGGAQLLGEAISMRNWGREGVLAAAAFVANPANNGATQAQLNDYVQQRITTVGASSNVALTVSPIPSGGTCPTTGSSSGICEMTVTLSETMYPVQSFFGGIRVQYTATAAVP